MNKALRSLKERSKTLLIIVMLPAAIIQYSQWWNGAVQIAESVSSNIERVSTVSSWIQK